MWLHCNYVRWLRHLTLVTAVWVEHAWPQLMTACCPEIFSPEVRLTNCVCRPVVLHLYHDMMKVLSHQVLAWRCRVCVCVVNLLLIYSFDCIDLGQNHTDHYWYFTLIMHLCFWVVCSFVVGTVVESSALWTDNRCEYFWSGYCFSAIVCVARCLLSWLLFAAAADFCVYFWVKRLVTITVDNLYDNNNNNVHL